MTPEGVLAIIGGYLIGGTPIGLLVGLAQGVDIRDCGSGNIGASNALRTLGVRMGAIVWLADVLKGWAPVYVVSYVASPDPLLLAAVGFAVVAGHCFSPYLKFAGGRGVSTGLGALLALDWRVGSSAFGVWILLVLTTRYISLASVVAAATAPIFFVVFGGPRVYLASGAGIALLIIGRHLPNIRRLRAGTETKIGEKARTRREKDG